MVLLGQYELVVKNEFRIKLNGDNMNNGEC